ncbi:MAG: class C sortase [Schaalia hyovaginalis]|uniref:class C sortase n=1 Tax=Schaalia hyovaginalis TaxID=29316 RepID=UPI0026F1AEE6|nr:class C sortase [Schaalia hyovaginalis]MCI6411310.1 class C sortase [Schaalia hyovaginalis]MDY4262718.1 class C sortase [Schaalia hyovaginalis]
MTFSEIPSRPARRRAGAQARPVRGLGASSARLVISLLLISGALITLWPIGRAATSALVTGRAVDTYRSLIEQAPDEQLADILAAAEAYNAALPAAALTDPWGEAAIGSAEHIRYLSLLDPDGDGIIGELAIPVIDVDLPIRHDATPESMAHGAGHMYGTSLPIGGLGTHAVLAAHTGSLTGTFFDRLPEVRVGDAFTVHVAGRALAYEVERIAVVAPDAVEEIAREDGSDLITLVTCVDLQADGTYAKRLLVRAHRVGLPTVPARITHPVARVIPGYDPRMDIRLVIGLSALILLAIFAIGWAKEGRSRAASGKETR